MNYFGEIISIGVAFSWTISALSCEVGSKHFGVIVLNVWRLALAMILSLVLMYFFTGEALPIHADAKAWTWLLASGAVGYFFGDWCLFNSYLTIGSRYGQLFMTTAPIFTTLAAWLLLDQKLAVTTLLAMAVTLSGIAISVFSRGENKTSFSLQLPLKGVLFGIGAGMGQGVGLVLSKIGLDYYTAAVPQAELQNVINFLPFSANSIRCLAGVTCYTLWMLFRGEGKRFTQSVHDHKGLAAMLLAVITGPFLGVGFSLMAVQHTAAGIASTLMATTPIIIFLPSYFIFHERITLKGVVGAVISVVGVALFFLW